MAPRRSAMDYESMATTMEADPLESSQIDKTRLTVIAQARKLHGDTPEAVSWARETMLMLGIHSSQDGDHQSELTPYTLNTGATYSHYGIAPSSLS